MKIPAKNDKRIICVVGPTASGKTALAVSLAKKFGGEIISADSRQVYRGLDIGTGKDLVEYGNIKYHLIDVADPMEDFTLFDWLEMANKAINEIISRDALPIIVGGTGLYVQALVEGFRQYQGKKNQGKRYERDELNKKSLKQLQEIYSKLKDTDINIDKNNPRRLIRAIEKSQEGTVFCKKEPDFESLQIGITLPRPILYEKIDKRVEQRFEEGMLEEVRGLIESGVNPSWLEKLGLEYRVISRYITSGSDDFEIMKQNLKWKIHAYARRQITWFRRFKKIKWVKDEKQAEKLVVKFFK